MIKFESVDKKYGTNFALKNIDLEFEAGEFICVIGTSGSGKTTLMRMINRMNVPTSGQVLIEGKNIQDYDEVELRRKIGYVIQNIGLFPHMTIRENIMIVPKLLKWTEQEKAGVAEELIQKVELPLDFLEKRPRNLSGGQQQRIGVIRALAADQSIILMDEPFGALDPITREALQELIKNLQKSMNKTIVFVTHDMDEALKLADRILIMDKGEAVQFDTPDQIVASPANEFVENLIGKNKKYGLVSNKTVRQIMKSPSVKIVWNQPVIKAVELMNKNKTQNIFVVDELNTLKGSLQLATIEATSLQEAVVSEVIQPTTAAINEKASLQELVYLFLNGKHEAVPVIDDNGQLIGEVTHHSLVEIIHEQME